ncbi:hypothetical protein CGCSCA4_v003717 [Colletotrichum siamense]|uniref:Uncharacterized protein n=1 Tax=Colletotrichum siamense TaxID=690259 RepID=A0A9P5K8V6_COLSI|nr:hypothetical protein CGCSCA5_v012404 [Colletotrichum siamense]KAF4850546.1 hypothetical protein CGCSCA4_v003717 [Colletotrichum siamense]KAF4862633.1 hypothetical protein CGCSCA2_v003463 [Colletotrichum siamense]KAF4865675.1 hypothetical protein CGCSCA1_v013916 [Colletotrichum siamense]
MISWYSQPLLRTAQHHCSDTYEQVPANIDSFCARNGARYHRDSANRILDAGDFQQIETNQDMATSKSLTLTFDPFSESRSLPLPLESPSPLSPTLPRHDATRYDATSLSYTVNVVRFAVFGHVVRRSMAQETPQRRTIPVAMARQPHRGP